MESLVPITRDVSNFRLIIRPATEADDAQLCLLRKEALTNAPTAFGADLSQTAPFEAGFWAERIRQNAQTAGGIIVVAEKLGAESGVGELIGMAGVYRGTGAKGLHGGTVWGVYVQPAYRGNRLVDDLINLCLVWAKQAGIRIAKLAVSVDRPGAQRAYERIGFVQYGVEPALIHYDGQDYDGIWMARWL